MDQYTVPCLKHLKQQCQLVVGSVQYRGNPVVCWECLLDDSQFVNSNRKSVVPFKDFVNKIVDELGKIKDDRQYEYRQLSKQDLFKENLDLLHQKQDDFKYYVQLKKDIVKEVIFQAIDTFSKQMEAIESELEHLLNLQYENFQKQIEYINHTYSKRYCLFEVPKEEEIVDELIRKQDDAQAVNDYIKSLKEWLLPPVDLNQNTLFLESLKDVKNKITVSQKKPHIDIPEINNYYTKSMGGVLDKLRNVLIDSVISINPAIEQQQPLNQSQARFEKSKNDFNSAFVRSLTSPQDKSTNIKFSILSSTQLESSANCITQISSSLSAVGTRTGIIEIYNKNGQIINSLLNHKDQISSLLKVQIQNKEVLVSSGSNIEPIINLWDLQSFRCIGTLRGHQSGITVLADIKDGQCFISGSYDNHSIIWNSITMKPVCALRKHTALISAIKVFENQVATASWDKTISIWRLSYQSGSFVVGCQYQKEIRDEFPIIALDILDNNIVYGGTNKWIKVYSLVTDQIVHTFLASNFGVQSLLTLSHGFIVGLSPNDQTIRIWKEGEELEVANIKDKNLVIANLNSWPLWIFENGELQVLTMKEQRSSILKFQIQIDH